MSHYDKLSQWYNFIAEGSESKLRRFGLDLLAVQPGESVLEVGTGTGRGLSALARDAGADGMVCGVDHSAGMLRQAKKHLSTEIKSTTVSLIRADGLRLPFEDDIFDAGFMCFTLETQGDARRADLLLELYRVMRPEGRLGVVCLCEGNGSRMERGYQWAHRQFPYLVDCRPIPVLDELEASGWQVMVASWRQIWGIPVCVSLAKKEKSLTRAEVCVNIKR